jgi:hypothetical protein
MFVRNLSFADPVRLVRKSILSALIGLMGGGVAVLAQQATDAPAPVVAQADAVQAPPAASAPGDVTPTAGTAAATDVKLEAAPDAKPDATADAKPEAPTDATPMATPVSAQVGPDGKPLAAAPAGKSGKKDKDKDKKKKKEKAPKLTPISIAQGTLTVDGWTGKARLNYDIPDLKYVYMWAPGIGTVVVSNVKFPLGKEEKDAFSGNTLTVDANGHTIQLYSEKRLLKDKKPESAWVYVDSAYRFPSTYPVMGYGNTIAAPYAWPGAKNVQLAKAGVAPPPPLPKNLRPTLVNQGGCVPAGSTAGTPCPAAPAAAPAPAAPEATPAAAPEAAPAVAPGPTATAPEAAPVATPAPAADSTSSVAAPATTSQNP